VIHASTLAGSVRGIGCFVLLFALISPRLALFFIWLFSDLLNRAYGEWVIPLLGFFLLPWTTLAFAVMWSFDDGVVGFDWFVVALAFLVDVGAFRGGDRRRRAEAR